MYFQLLVILRLESTGCLRKAQGKASEKEPGGQGLLYSPGIPGYWGAACLSGGSTSRRSLLCLAPLLLLEKGLYLALAHSIIGSKCSLFMLLKNRHRAVPKDTMPSRKDRELRWESGYKEAEGGEQAVVTGPATESCQSDPKGLRALIVSAQGLELEVSRLRSPVPGPTQELQSWGPDPQGFTWSHSSSSYNLLWLTPVYLTTADKCSTIQQLPKTGT